MADTPPVGYGDTPYGSPIPVNNSELRTLLRLPAGPDELDQQLDSLLLAATEYVQSACIVDFSQDGVTPTERQRRAIMFHACWYFMHPASAEPNDVDGFQRVMDLLLAWDRKFTYPDPEAI